MKSFWQLLIQTLVLIGTLYINYQASSGGNSIGEVSRQYDTLLTPAGYAFSIWGLIYLFQLAFVGFQWYRWRQNPEAEELRQTGYWYALTNLANACWVLSWVNEHLLLSVLCMFTLLFALTQLTLRLRLEVWDAPVRTIAFVWWPICIYLGWIVLATVANLSAALYGWGWEGTPLRASVWAILIIGVATGIYLFLLRERNLREALAVGAWGFLAIAYKQWGEAGNVAVAAVAAALLLLAAAGYHAYQNRRTNPLEKARRGEWT